MEQIIPSVCHISEIIIVYWLKLKKRHGIPPSQILGRRKLQDFLSIILETLRNETYDLSSYLPKMTYSDQRSNCRFEKIF